MNNRQCKRRAVFLVALAMVISVIPTIFPAAQASEDIKNPGQYTVQLFPYETEYKVEMRPQIAKMVKTIYYDAEYTELITEPVTIPPGQTVYIYAKYVEDTILPEPYTLYYRLRIIGRSTSEILYLDKVAGVEVDPGFEGGEGTISNPFTAKITVPNSQNTITHILGGGALQPMSDLTFRGGTQGVAYTHPDIRFSLDVNYASRVIPLNEGSNTIYISVISGNGNNTYYYVITVFREPNQHTLVGRVQSYNPQRATKIDLYTAGTKNLAASTTIEALPTGSGQIIQEFKLINVPEGIYDLVVSKQTHLNYTITGVTVGASNLDLTANPDSKINSIVLLCGDINGDGFINSTDLSILILPINYNRSISDPGVNPLTDLLGTGVANSSTLSVLILPVNYNKTHIICAY